MIRIYLDSSAFVKRFNEEHGSEIVKEIFDRCEMGKLVIVVSQWTINETIVAFDKLSRIGNSIDSIQANSKIIDAISWVYDRRNEGNLEMVGIDDNLIANSVGFIRFNHLSADDSLHGYCAVMGRANMILMHDSRFSYWLKNPDAKSKDEDETRPRYYYHVINLEDTEDTDKLRKELDLGV